MLTFNNYRFFVGSEPNGLVVRAMAHLPSRRLGEALDLGAGNLRDSAYLVGQGFEPVTAIDYMPMPLPQEGVVTKQLDLRAFVPMPNTFDFACCVNVLFFVSADDAARIITRAWNGLREGGILAINLLGDADEWVRKQTPWSCGYSHEQMEALISPFQVLETRHAAFHASLITGGSKYWDIWEHIIRK